MLQRRGACLSSQLLRFKLASQALRRCQSTIAYEMIKASPPAASNRHNDLINPEPVTAVVIHGLLGMGKNWRTWSRNFATAAAELTNRPWRMVLVDQRCHGNSKDLTDLRPPHTIGASATDIAQLFRSQFSGQGPAMVIGHSLGGKVALDYVRQKACGLDMPRQVWSLDTNPGRLTSDLGDVALVMDSIGHLTGPMFSRQSMMTRLEEAGFAEGLRLWLGSNMVSDKRRGGLRWTFDLHGAQQMYASFKHECYWEDLAAPPVDVTVNVLRAADSDRWSPEMIDKLANAQKRAMSADAATTGRLCTHLLPHAGHWVHVDNPGTLRQLILATAKDAAGQ